MSFRQGEASGDSKVDGARQGTEGSACSLLVLWSSGPWEVVHGSRGAAGPNDKTGLMVMS